MTKKLAELTMDALSTIKTPIRPMSVFPIAVNRVRAEKGVIIAHPGNKSLALRSIDQTKPSSPVKRRYNVFWWRAASNLQRQASRVNLSSRQFAKIRCWVEDELNILANFWFKGFNATQRVLIKPLLFCKTEKVLTKLSTGVTWPEYQFSTSANCNDNLFTNRIL